MELPKNNIVTRFCTKDVVLRFLNPIELVEQIGKALEGAYCKGGKWLL